MIDQSVICTYFSCEQQVDINNIDMISLPYSTLNQFAHTPVISFLSSVPFPCARQCLAYFLSTSLYTRIFLVGQNKLYGFIMLVRFCNRTILLSCYAPLWYIV